MTGIEKPKLLLYNTLGKTKQQFQPIDPNRITMYVCGPTVYNRVHIGNARPVVVFDTLYRPLPSIITATWAGSRVGSSSGGQSVEAVRSVLVAGVRLIKTANRMKGFPRYALQAAVPQCC